MPDSVRDFYDQLAGEYHLIYADWRKAVMRQGAVLDRLIRSELGNEPFSILDCACGIGTQAIGLALRGHTVRATDISEASVERARAEAAAFDVKIEFDVADFRALERTVPGEFDVVIACDNALPHLVEDADLAAAARSMCAKLRPGGLLIVSTRDYDEVRRDTPHATEPEVFDGPDGRRIVFQLWEWEDGARTYTVNLFIGREEAGEWSFGHHATRYRALRRSELTDTFRAAGLDAIRWHTPPETGFFQPVATARRP